MYEPVPFDCVDTTLTSIPTFLAASCAELLSSVAALRTERTEIAEAPARRAMVTRSIEIEPLISPSAFLLEAERLHSCF
jgi:hypothetical protein